jgi:hypothetical protein
MTSTEALERELAALAALEKEAGLIEGDGDGA